MLFTRCAGHTDRQTDTHTHTHTHTDTQTQTNWSENTTPPRFCGGVKKKHSENADTSMTFDLDVWPWPYVKKAYVIRCRLSYCTLVSIRYNGYDFCELNIWCKKNRFYGNDIYSRVSSEHILSMHHVHFLWYSYHVVHESIACYKVMPTERNT